MSFFFFECDGGCGSTDFSLKTIKVFLHFCCCGSLLHVQAVVESKEDDLLPCFCFDCRAFTKQARLVYTVKEGKPFRQFFAIEPLGDCKPGCKKHDELKKIVSWGCFFVSLILFVSVCLQKEQRDVEWGKYWCNKCEIYSADYRAQEIDIKIRHGTVLPCFSRCTCNENFYWCTECRVSPIVLSFFLTLCCSAILRSSGRSTAGPIWSQMMLCQPTSSSAP